MNNGHINHCLINIKINPLGKESPIDDSVKLQEQHHHHNTSNNHNNNTCPTSKSLNPSSPSTSNSSHHLLESPIDSHNFKQPPSINHVNTIEQQGEEKQHTNISKNTSGHSSLSFEVSEKDELNLKNIQNYSSDEIKHNRHSSTSNSETNQKSENNVMSLLNGQDKNPKTTDAENAFTSNNPTTDTIPNVLPKLPEPDLPKNNQSLHTPSPIPHTCHAESIIPQSCHTHEKFTDQSSENRTSPEKKEISTEKLCNGNHDKSLNSEKPDSICQVGAPVHQTDLVSQSSQEGKIQCNIMTVLNLSPKVNGHVDMNDSTTSHNCCDEQQTTESTHNHQNDSKDDIDTTVDNSNFCRNSSNLNTSNHKFINQNPESLQGSCVSLPISVIQKQQKLETSTVNSHASKDTIVQSESNNKNIIHNPCIPKPPTIGIEPPKLNFLQRTRLKQLEKENKKNLNNTNCVLKDNFVANYTTNEKSIQIDPASITNHLKSLTTQPKSIKIPNNTPPVAPINPTNLNIHSNKQTSSKHKVPNIPSSSINLKNSKHKQKFNHPSMSIQPLGINHSWKSPYSNQNNNSNSSSSNLCHQNHHHSKLNNNQHNHNNSQHRIIPSPHPTTPTPNLSSNIRSKLIHKSISPISFNETRSGILKLNSSKSSKSVKINTLKFKQDYENTHQTLTTKTRSQNKQHQKSEISNQISNSTSHTGPFNNLYVPSKNEKVPKIIRKNRKHVEGIMSPGFNGVSHIKNLCKYNNSLKIEKNDRSKSDKKMLDTSMASVNAMKSNLNAIDEKSSQKLELDQNDTSYVLKKVIFDEFEECKLDKNLVMPRLAHPDVQLLNCLIGHQRQNLITNQEISSIIKNQTSKINNLPVASQPTLKQAIQSAISHRSRSPKTSKINSIETVIPKTIFAPLTNLTHNDLKHLTGKVEVGNDVSKKVISILSSYCSQQDLERLSVERKMIEKKSELVDAKLMKMKLEDEKSEKNKKHSDQHHKHKESPPSKKLPNIKLDSTQESNETALNQIPKTTINLNSSFKQPLKRKADGNKKSNRIEVKEILTPNYTILPHQQSSTFSTPPNKKRLISHNLPEKQDQILQDKIFQLLELDERSRYFAFNYTDKKSRKKNFNQNTDSSQHQNTGPANSFISPIGTPLMVGSLVNVNSLNFDNFLGANNLNEMEKLNDLTSHQREFYLRGRKVLDLNEKHAYDKLKFPVEEDTWTRSIQGDRQLNSSKRNKNFSGNTASSSQKQTSSINNSNNKVSTKKPIEQPKLIMPRPPIKKPNNKRKSIVLDQEDNSSGDEYKPETKKINNRSKHNSGQSKRSSNFSVPRLPNYMHQNKKNSNASKQVLEKIEDLDPKNIDNSELEAMKAYLKEQEEEKLKIKRVKELVAKAEKEKKRKLKEEKSAKTKKNSAAANKNSKTKSKSNKPADLEKQYKKSKIENNKRKRNSNSFTEKQDSFNNFISGGNNHENANRTRPRITTTINLSNLNNTTWSVENSNIMNSSSHNNNNNNNDKNNSLLNNTVSSINLNQSYGNSTNLKLNQTLDDTVAEQLDMSDTESESETSSSESSSDEDWMIKNTSINKPPIPKLKIRFKRD